jgi:hypothetical protein
LVKTHDPRSAVADPQPHFPDRKNGKYAGAMRAEKSVYGVFADNIA